MGKGATSPQRRTLASEKCLRVAELVRDGWTFPEIAKELGYKDRSGPRKALERYHRELDRQGARDIEAHRRKLEDRLDKAHKVADGLLKHEDPKVKLEAVGKISRNVDVQGRISGVVKLAPQIVVPPPPEVFDVSELTAEELWTFRSLLKKIKRKAPTSDFATSNEGEKQEA